jgi:membrane protease YdiL (CAAX protease family)
VVFAPVVEEMLFRGILFPLLKKIGPSSFAYLMSALLFAVIHINLVTFIPLFFLGLVLAWLVERTDNLLAPITAHAVFNLAATTTTWGTGTGSAPRCSGARIAMPAFP